MSKERVQRIEELFQQVADLPPSERSQFLAEHTESDAALRTEVAELLALYDGAAPPELPTPGGTRTRPVLNEKATRVGPYRLLEQIGEGGCGVVYRAEQTEPVRRTVALKIIKEGMDTREVVARFEAERQALALMDHPGIAKVFDAGATERGRPYFVMEHVPGERITDYCDRCELDTDARLRLFVEVCDAIQHAHQRGIIHRDLKPSNVLVETVGDRPLPKVIDFGIAKAIGGHLTERTLYTEQGQLIGTPEYMSPEQAELTGLHVDTRTDIYSLGVVLYELLTGTLPFDPQTLRDGTLADIQKRIRTEEPPKPSTRVSTGGEAATTHAKKRHSDTRTLTRRLRGDLDWITMKAMEKEAARRYASASELAADVQRHQQHEPILARPPSVTYRFRKFARRNKVAVVAASLVLASLLIGIFATTAALLEARRAQGEEAEQRVAAEHEAVKAGAVRDFLFYALGFANPAAKEGEDMTVETMLQLATADLDTLFEAEPKAQAAVLLMLAQSRFYQLKMEDAKRLVEKALLIFEEKLPPGHIDRARALWTLIMIGIAEVGSEPQRELRLRYLQVCVHNLEAGYPQLASELDHFGHYVLTIETLNHSETTRRYEALMDSYARSGAAAPETFHLALGQLLVRVGNSGHLRLFERINEDIIALARTALAQEAEPRSRLQLKLQLSLRLFVLDAERADAVERAKELNEIAATLFPAGHVWRRLCRAKLGEALAGKESYAEAEQILEEVHPDLVQARERGFRLALSASLLLPNLYVDTDRPERAAPILEAELMREEPRRSGDLRRLVKWAAVRAFHLNQVSWAVVRTPGFDEGLYRLAHEAATKVSRVIPRRWAVLNTLGVAQYRVGRYEEALETLGRSEDLSQGGSPANQAVLAMVYRELGKEDEARAALTRTRELMKEPENARKRDYQRLVREAERRLQR